MPHFFVPLKQNTKIGGGEGEMPKKRIFHLNDELLLCKLTEYLTNNLTNTL